MSNGKEIENVRIVPVLYGMIGTKLECVEKTPDGKAYCIGAEVPNGKKSTSHYRPVLLILLLL